MSRSRDRRVPAHGVSLLGAALLALPVAHVLTSDGPPLPAAVEVTPPTLLLAAVVAYGVRVARASPASVSTVFAGAGVGALGGVVVSGWVLALTALGGVPRPDPLFDVSASVALGATLGAAGGGYAARLRTRSAELAAANRRLDEFASVVSHDLRNPLNVAQGRVDLARETGDVSHLDPAKRALDRIDGIVDASLELARTGADAGERERVVVADVARAAADTVRSVPVDVETGDLTVEADGERLRTLFENCFRNAAEHGVAPGPTAGPGSDGGDGGGGDGGDGGGGDGGGSRVEPPAVVVGRIDDGADPAGFFVADDGRGIPEDERDDVFTRGYSTADDGTGLGLAVVARIAESHGWEPSAAESADGGARFEFRFR